MRFLVTMGDVPERSSFFTPRVIAELEKYGEVQWNTRRERGMTKEELIAQIPDVDVLLTGWGTAPVDADVLRAANRLKVHAHTGGSVASYVSKEEYDAGIVVLSGNDLFARSVAEGCLCYTLCATRRIPAFQDTLRQGGWQPENNTTEGLIGKRIGIVGYGAIARYYMELLHWFHPELLLASKYATQADADRYGARLASLEEVFSTCDVISLHAALNAENRGMITESLLRSIRPGALFVNTARAGLIEEQALYAELKTGRFQAVLDVYHQEPLPPDHLLRTLPNVMLMPHMAGPTFDMREKVVLQLLADVLALQRGEACASRIPYEYAARMTVG